MTAHSDAADVIDGHQSLGAADELEGLVDDRRRALPV